MKELEAKYAAGADIGDGHVKLEVAAAINELLEPTLERVKHHANLVAWPRALSYV